MVREEQGGKEIFIEGVQTEAGHNHGDSLLIDQVSFMASMVSFFDLTNLIVIGILILTDDDSIYRIVSLYAGGVGHLNG